MNQENIEKLFLEMADIAVSNGADLNDIADIALKLDFIPCVWCKERGHYPSVYLKKSDEFSNGMSDALLNGKVCNECIKNGNDFSY